MQARHHLQVHSYRALYNHTGAPNTGLALTCKGGCRLGTGFSVDDELDGKSNHGDRTRQGSHLWPHTLGHVVKYSWAGNYSGYWLLPRSHALQHDVKKIVLDAVYVLAIIHQLGMIYTGNS